MLFGFLVVIFLPTFCESFRLSIIGGQKSNIISFPYQLSMSFNGFFTCGASIISPNFALTAGNVKNIFFFMFKTLFSAHCTIYQDAKDMTLRAGSSFRSNFGIEISVTHIIQHPKFSIRTYDFDFSLLKFQTALPFGPRIRPVKLPEEEEWLQPGSKCLVSGFGRTEDGDVPEDLRSTGIEIIEEKRCKLSFAAIGFNVTSHMVII